MSRQHKPKRHLFLKTFIVFCLLGAVIVLVRAPSRGNVQREVTAKIDSCKYDARTRLVDVTYTLMNPGKHDAGAAIDLRYVDKAGNALGTDIVYVPRVTPGSTVRGAETSRIEKPRTLPVTCDFSLHAV